MQLPVQFRVRSACDDAAVKRRPGVGEDSVGGELYGRILMATGRTPETTGAFWLTQALIAGTGACAAFTLSSAVGYLVAVVFAVCVFVTALTVQFRTQVYTVWVYWAVVSATGVAGALAGGIGRGGLQDNAAWVTVAVAVVVVPSAVIGARRLEAATARPPQMRTWALELLYWSAAFATFAAGAGVARLMTAALPIGRAISQVVLAVLVVSCLVVQQVAGRAVAFCAWGVSVMVPPWGICFAQWLALPLGHGGLGWGQGPVTVLLGVVVAGQFGRLAESEQIRLATPGTADHVGGG